MSNYPAGVSEADFDGEPDRVFIECGCCMTRFTEDVDPGQPCPECGCNELAVTEERDEEWKDRPDE